VTGISLFVFVLVIVLLAGVALTTLAFVGAHLLFRLFGKTSGLHQLAELYPTSWPPPGQVHKKQWVEVGGVRYANNAQVCATPEGLCLWVHPLFSSYQPARIPWGELKNPQPTTLYLRNAVRLTVGDPQVTTVVFTQRLVERLQPYLS